MIGSAHAMLCIEPSHDPRVATWTVSRRGSPKVVDVCDECVDYLAQLGDVDGDELLIEDLLELASATT